MPFTYTGDDERIYPQYRDADTGRILTVAPGGAYSVEAIIAAMPVPPDDGRWAAAAAGGSPPAPRPPASPPPPPPAAAVSTPVIEDEGN